MAGCDTQIVVWACGQEQLGNGFKDMVQVQDGIAPAKSWSGLTSFFVGRVQVEGFPIQLSIMVLCNRKIIYGK